MIEWKKPGLVVGTGDKAMYVKALIYVDANLFK